MIWHEWLRMVDLLFERSSFRFVCWDWKVFETNEFQRKLDKFSPTRAANGKWLLTRATIEKRSNTFLFSFNKRDKTSWHKILNMSWTCLILKEMMILPKTVSLQSLIWKLWVLSKQLLWGSERNSDVKWLVELSFH